MSNINKQQLREEFQYMQNHYSDPADHDRQVIYLAAEAMLDELEAVQKTSEARRAAILRTHKMFQKQRDRAAAAEKRIAELEAREVTLPAPACTYADHSYPAYSERQVVALLGSLGIITKVGE